MPTNRLYSMYRKYLSTNCDRIFRLIRTIEEIIPFDIKVKIDHFYPPVSYIGTPTVTIVPDDPKDTKRLVCQLQMIGFTLKDKHALSDGTLSLVLHRNTDYDEMVYIDKSELTGCRLVKVERLVPAQTVEVFVVECEEGKEL